MVREVGTLDLSAVQGSLDALPDTVQVGVPVWVSAATIASPCGNPPGPETEVAVVDNVATITPFDWRYVGGTDCPSVAAYYPHRVSVQFTAPGPARVIVQGRDTNVSRDLTVIRPDPR